ncbi:hypothetical protein AGDE_16522 [Angomonas deanei]|uniref:NAD dependent epimerase/dehydratase family n=1 Tax=Angomonas deanei TaxID=59799 RepID=A0A7G2CQ63_9TRYP|nr:hypothetical protein AGDE_16522 [Angomonas deanei]CAD2221489.1 hypothetical protein, conserved [Angomonas deanei]|eukprot:EPY16945.1 hypothetical protein AGDE_16522 [Angomonas deanei]
MKRVLILNGDSFVGIQTAKTFFYSKEYEVSVTLTNRDDDTALKVRYTPPKKDAATLNPIVIRGEPLSVKETLSALDGEKNEEEEEILIPAALQPYIQHVVPSHNANPEAFCRLLLEQDVVVAVLEDDSYEAECAIKVLLGSHYEVEKTFVLVSSVMTWAYTVPSERSRARAAKREEMERERLNFLEEREEGEEEEEIPEHLTEEYIQKQFEGELDDEEGEALVPMRTFTEADYGLRVPHPRYQQWKMIEHLTKHANSESLHTYVLFAGLPYGQGEGELQGYLRKAMQQAVLPLYGSGLNHIPMIHVDDLAAIIFKVGNSYDVLEDRYMFAVDRGNITQAQLLNCLSRRIGGVIRPAPWHRA